MQFKRRQTSIQAKIDLTALIDIVFILLVFFLLSASHTYPHGLEINLPSTESSKHITKQHVEISIDSLNQIYLDQNSISFKALRDELNSISKERLILLKSDEDASYGIMLKVFDLLRTLNFKTISLASKKSSL